jgi:hypothetical protein
MLASHSPQALDEPMFGTLKTAKRISGSSNSKLYQLIGSGQIKAKKLGRRLLIDLRSLYVFLERLPDAKIAPPRPRRSNKQASVTLDARALARSRAKPTLYSESERGRIEGPARRQLESPRSRRQTKY